MRALDEIISPVESATFFSEYYGRNPLHIEAAASDRFDKLLSLDDIDRLLSTIRFRTPDLFVKQAGRTIDVSSITVRGDLIDMVKVYSLHTEGATIVLNRLHTYHPPLAELCYALETQFSAPCQANVYLSPGDVQGLNSHFDTHDVFILQVSGCKRWKLYGQPIPQPLAGHGGQGITGELGSALLERELTPGGVLYIPRGVVHDATALDTTSLHITLGVFSFTWADLLLEALASAVMSDAAFRSSLPIDFASANVVSESLQVEFRRLALHFAECAPVVGAVDALKVQLSGKRRPNLRGQLLQIAMAQRIAAGTRLSPRPFTQVSLIADDSRLRLRCNHNDLTFPLTARSALEYILGSSHFSVSDIPGDLEPAERIELVRKLVYAEVLTVESGAS